MDESLVLIDDSRHQVGAPADFDWKAYPERLVHAGREYDYIGTVDGTPHYQLAKVE